MCKVYLETISDFNIMKGYLVLSELLSDRYLLKCADNCKALLILSKTKTEAERGGNRNGR